MRCIFYREKISALSSVIDSRRIVLTHTRRSQQLILFKISPRRDSNSRTNTRSVRGLPLSLVHRGDRCMYRIKCFMLLVVMFFAHTPITPPPGRNTTHDKQRQMVFHTWDSKILRCSRAADTRNHNDRIRLQLLLLAAVCFDILSLLVFPSLFTYIYLHA